MGQYRQRRREVEADIRADILDLRNLGQKGVEIEQRLKPIYGDRLPKLRTIQRIAAPDPNETPEQKQRRELLDSVFEWHRMDEYQLPWEASEYLLEVFYFTERTGQEDSENWGKEASLTVLPGITSVSEGSLTWRGPASPEERVFTIISGPTRYGISTARMMRWCWRVHQALPDASISEVLKYGEILRQSEIKSEFDKQPADHMDLQFLFMYKPWLDEERRISYETNVSDEMKIQYGGGDNVQQT